MWCYPIMCSQSTVTYYIYSYQICIRIVHVHFILYTSFLIVEWYKNNYMCIHNNKDL